MKLPTDFALWQSVPFSTLPYESQPGIYLIKGPVHIMPEGKNLRPTVPIGMSNIYRLAIATPEGHEKPYFIFLRGIYPPTAGKSPANFSPELRILFSLRAYSKLFAASADAVFGVSVSVDSTGVRRSVNYAQLPAINSPSTGEPLQGIEAILMQGKATLFREFGSGVAAVPSA